MTEQRDSVTAAELDEITPADEVAALRRILLQRENETEAALAALRRKRDEARGWLNMISARLEQARADIAKKDAALREASRWLGWAERRLHPSLATYIPRDLLPLAPAAQGYKHCGLHEDDCCGADGPDCPYDATELAAMDRSAPAPSAGETDEEDVKTELRFWLGWAHRRLSPIHASYIPARFLLAAAPTTGETR